MIGLDTIERMVAKARNNYKANRDPQAEGIIRAENSINTHADAVMLGRAVQARFLVHPAGTSRFYILLTP